MLGTSRGAEAALLLGALHEEVDAVVAISPSDVVWAALSGDRPQRSSWTRGGEPLVSHPEAGHRVVLPGETPPPPSHLAHGGTPEAGRALGERLWPELLRLIRS